MKPLLLVLATLALSALSAAQEVLVVQSWPRGAVRVLRVSPDGRWLASLSDELLQVWNRGGGVLWSVPVGAAEGAGLES